MKIKRTAALTVMIGVCASLSYADINVNWFNTGGYIPNRERTGGAVDEGTPILSNPFNPSGDLWIQLVFAGADGINNEVLPGGAAGGDDVVLLEGQLFGTFGAPTTSPYIDSLAPINLPSVAFQAGNIFGRIFEVATGAEAVAGTWYYDGPLVAAADIAPGPNPPAGTPQEYRANLNTLPGGFGDELNLQVVPEPTSLALLGLGALSAAWFRRRQRR